MQERATPTVMSETSGGLVGPVNLSEYMTQWGGAGVARDKISRASLSRPSYLVTLIAVDTMPWTNSKAETAKVSREVSKTIETT